MAKLKNGDGSGSANVFRFNLPGLIVFCLCLIAGSAFITGKVVGARQKSAPLPVLNIPDPDEIDRHTTLRQGPWGELLTQDISLERPLEYLSEEMKTVPPTLWTFRGMNLAQVKALFIANGLTWQETEKALASDRVSTRGNDTLFKPSDEFVFSLRPEARQRLYEAMRGRDVNLYSSGHTITPKTGSSGFMGMPDFIRTTWLYSRSFFMAARMPGVSATMIR